MAGHDLCECLEWDSAFFHRSIGRINAHTLTDAQACDIRAWARERQVECLYLLADTSDLTTPGVVARHGFQLTDVRVTLEYHPVRGETIAPATPMVRAWAVEDVPSLRTIAASSHRDTRFYHDGHFPRQLCDDLYATWIEKSCFGFAQHVIVAEADRQVAGYVSVHRDSEQRGHIGLIGVDTSVRRRGCGNALIEGAIAWFAERDITTVSVATQGRNPAAVRLYERCGFRTGDVQVWYHWWPDPMPEEAA